MTWSSRRLILLFLQLLALTIGVGCAAETSDPTGQKASQVVSTSLTVYATSQSVVVNWANETASNTNYVAIAPAGAPNTTLTAWSYAPGVSGTHTFAALPAGSYEARFFRGDNTLESSQAFTVNAYTVATDKPSYTGGTVVVSWTGSLAAKDWVGIAPVGSSDSTVTQFAYTNGVAASSASFTVNAGGNWRVRFYTNDTFTVVAETTFVVSNGVSTDKSSYNLGEAVAVTWSNSSSARDYVAVAPVGATDSTITDYVYTGGTAAGSTKFFNLTAGSWRVRLYQNDTYTYGGEATFTVTSTPSTPAFTVTTDKSAYSVSSTCNPSGSSCTYYFDTVNVNWTGSTSAKDYVAIALVGSADNKSIQWAYTNGVASGSKAFLGGQAGTYRVRLYTNDSFNPVAEAHFTVATGTPGGTGVTYTIATDKSSYSAGEPTVVSWTSSTTTTDWVGILPQGSSTLTAWAYTNGVPNTGHSFSGLAVGTYTARFYIADTGLYTAETTFTVTAAVAGGTTGVATDKATYGTGSTVTVSWGASTAAKDWVGIAPVGAADSTYPTGWFWSYTSGVSNGSKGFTGIPAGSYRVRFYTNDTFTYTNEATFAVSNDTVATDKSAYGTGATVTVNWTTSANANDWVGIAPVGTADSTYPTGWFWSYTNAVVNGSHAFTGIPSGNYRVRFYLNDSFTYVAEALFTVNGSSVNTDQSTYGAGTSVLVSWTTTTNSHDWVGITPVGTADSTYPTGWIWAYTNGVANGSKSFSGLTAGSYRVRFYLNDTFNYTAEALFTVTGGTVSTDKPTYLVGETVNVNWTTTTNIHDGVGKLPPIVTQEFTKDRAVQIGMDVAIRSNTQWSPLSSLKPNTVSLTIGPNCP